MSNHIAYFYADVYNFPSSKLCAMSRPNSVQNLIRCPLSFLITLQWRHNEHYGVSNHRISTVYSTVCSGADQINITGLCEGNSPVTGEFPAQMASNRENVSIWWRHHELSGWHHGIWDHRSLFEGMTLTSHEHRGVSINNSFGLTTNSG